MSGLSPHQRPPIRFRPYAFHFFSAIAVSSMAIHALNQRKASDDERQALTAKTTILEELVARLRTGEAISTDEVDRLVNLSNAHAVGGASSAEVSKAVSKDGAELGWRDAVFGKKADPRSVDEDLVKLRKELEEAFIDRPKLDVTTTVTPESKSTNPRLVGALQPSVPVPKQTTFY
ncbi:hypothetical protein FRB95_000559 [Tulasnella sp. JGI-2019a]|nr:hypothetical protein FRB95_000559 [Tulasnella sp. JGI-2019a]